MFTSVATCVKPGLAFASTWRPGAALLQPGSGSSRAWHMREQARVCRSCSSLSPACRLVAVAHASEKRHTQLSAQECIYHAFIFYYSCPGPSNKVDCSFCCTAFNRRFLEALRRSSTILRMDGAGGSISGIGACSVSSVFLTWSPT